ncbi:hypothetical protein SISNIDRAFT_429451 [Sistotremastrum niveocremeum HHB9708]|uniref:T6SS Phospholipase effector Tle1-like catalytic domain-containing protein n=1 Tax=Sistotremastrum niveocremeum HHB9708 TaxID=1314777 RepID=A0A164TAL2_9AGAM|nr:hypothetical protein SISNIDRAFT_429451 [Sistotremastrum niveocremeum HHB9708]
MNISLRFGRNGCRIGQSSSGLSYHTSLYPRIPNIVSRLGIAGPFVSSAWRRVLSSRSKFDNTCWPPIDETRARTLVLCFDGTADQFDDDNSNIVNFFRLLKKDDPGRQMCYYQAGVGTYRSVHVARRGIAKLPLPYFIESFITKRLDEAFASYLHTHVQEGYNFLMQHYAVGDKICLFGFSRGAYIARALAGMLDGVGLLPRGNEQQVDFAWKMYRDHSAEGLVRAAEFKSTFSTNVEVEFMGVFDTVASVGLIPRSLPFATSSHAIHTMRQALSLDERRAKFKPSHFHNPPPISDETKRKIKATQIGETLAQQDSKSGKTTTAEEADDGLQRGKPDIKEVWFAGGHRDVGGGNWPNNIKHSLAIIPLRWMVRECMTSNTGILFDLAHLASIGLTTSHLPLLPKVPEPDSAKPKALYGPEDALSESSDELSRNRAWWLLEYYPLRTKELDKDLRQVPGYSAPNLGRGRVIPTSFKRNLLVHRSVQYRTEKCQDYTPNACWRDQNGRIRRLDLRDPDPELRIHW